MHDLIRMACRAYRHHDMGSLLEDDYVLVDGPGVQQQHDLPEVFKLPLCNGLDLFETTVEDLQHLFETGSLTSVQYTRYCLEMIRRVCFWASREATLGISLRQVGQPIFGMCHRDESRCFGHCSSARR